MFVEWHPRVRGRVIDERSGELLKEAVVLAPLELIQIQVAGIAIDILRVDAILIVAKRNLGDFF